MDSQVPAVRLSGIINVAEDPHYKLGMTMNDMCHMQGDIIYLYFLLLYIIRLLIYLRFGSCDGYAN